MIKPPVVKPQDEVTILAKVFDTRLVSKGKTWFPLAQLVAWPIMAWVAKKRRPERSWLRSFGVGALTMPVVLGSEWGHNLAHAAAAKMVAKPVDAIRVVYGMPLLVYYDINAEDVTPRQHIVRALGGPLFNLCILPIALILRRRLNPDSVVYDITDAAVATNVFLPGVGLLPIPGIDGGPILKWSLVEAGASPADADRKVRKVDGVLSLLFALTALRAFNKRRYLRGALLANFAVLCLGIALGWLKEQD